MDTSKDSALFSGNMLVTWGAKKPLVKKAQVDLEDLYKTHQMSKSEKPVYVSVYEVSRAYGGPEEGGWWYDDYSLESSKKFYDRSEAEAFANTLENGIEQSGANEEDISSARGMDQYPDPSGGDPMYDHSDADIPVGFSGLARNYRVVIEDVQGERASRGAPHYE